VVTPGAGRGTNAVCEAAALGWLDSEVGCIVFVGARCWAPCEALALLPAVGATGAGSGVESLTACALGWGGSAPVLLFVVFGLVV
jgi:hypothetical protein